MRPALGNSYPAAALVYVQVLTWDVEVPAESVDVRVEDGWVTLSGEVDFRFESDAAFDDVASLYGVVGITDEITVSTSRRRSSRGG